MPRWGLFLLCVLSGLAAIAWALLVPAHLRSVDERVLQRHSRGTPGLVDAVLRENNRSVALLGLQAAKDLQAGRLELLQEHVSNLPPATNQIWGRTLPPAQPVLATFIRSPHQTLSEVRRLNTSFEASTVLRTAGLTNLSWFGRAGTAAGQPLEASILITTALIQEGALHPQLQSELVVMMSRAQSAEIEPFYLDILALARRLDWEQLAFLTRRFESLQALSGFAESVRQFENRLPSLVWAVALAETTASVPAYLLRYGQSGLPDLEHALVLGSGALRHLLQRQQPVWHPSLRETLTSNPVAAYIFDPLLHMAVKWPRLALLFKYELIFAGGFLLALALKFWKPRSEEQLGYVWFSHMRLARQAIFGLLAVMLVIALGEPYLAQGDQRIEPMPRINLSLAAANPPPAAQAPLSQNMIDQYTILALVMFLVLQGIIYAVCLLKLAEIRKQALSSQMKLKLLDNEENLFDSGLYVGLFGTVASLVFLALGILKPSLVAAYSSTLFGILFVAILKIGHVRPYKRLLLLDADSHHA